MEGRFIITSKEIKNYRGVLLEDIDASIIVLIGNCKLEDCTMAYIKSELEDRFTLEHLKRNTFIYRLKENCIFSKFQIVNPVGWRYLLATNLESFQLVSL